MKLNVCIRYAVACLFELSRHVGEYVDAEQIGRRQNIPIAYAQKVLQRLARAGLLLSQKGLGFRLLRPLESITAFEVIDALNRVDESNGSIERLLERRIESALRHVTLEDLHREILGAVR